VVGAFGGFTTAVEEKEGTTPIFFCGTQGKFLAELRMLKNGDLTELKSNLHYLNATYPNDATMQAKVEAALAEINSRNKALAQTASPPAGSVAAAAPQTEAKSFLTSVGCKSCHASEYAAWESSKHAHAINILVEKNAEFNPECVGCHVLGYKRKDGFVDLRSTPELANVHCESCHGPGTRHLQNTKATYGKTSPMSCVRCHTKENSPSFDYNTYWMKIRHGGA
jgi:mono/diheme cytochrome c family protein